MSSKDSGTPSPKIGNINCNHESDLGKWNIEYYSYFCYTVETPVWKVTCTKCLCNMTDIIEIPIGLSFVSESVK